MELLISNTKNKEHKNTLQNVKTEYSVSMLLELSVVILNRSLAKSTTTFFLYW